MNQYCFAWSKEQRKCTATVFACDGKNLQCPFYKTREDFARGQRAAAERIETLPEDKKATIHDNYYMRSDK